MIRQLCIAAALSFFFASMLSGCGGGAASSPAAENQVDLPKAPKAVPKFEPAPEKAGPTASKLQMPEPLLAEMNQKMQAVKPLGNLTGVTWMVGGLAKDSLCTKAFQDSIKAPGPDATAHLTAACKDAVSKIETIWLQVDFKEGGVVKSEKAVISIDGAALAKLMQEEMQEEEKRKAEEEKRKADGHEGGGVADGDAGHEEEKGKEMIDHIESFNLDMEGLNKITAWVDLSHEFITSLQNEITLDETTIRKMLNPSSELRHVTSSCLSHAKLLTSDMLFPFAPRSAVPSSIVARRLAADLTPVQPPNPADACFYQVPKEMLTLMNAAQPNATVESVSFTFGGMSAKGDCCTNIMALAKIATDPAKKDEGPAAHERFLMACMKELPGVNGVWASAKFTPTGDVPITGASGFGLVDPEALTKMMPDLQKPDAKMQLGQQAFAGLQRFYLGITYSKAQMWYAFKDFPIIKAGGMIEYDEAKMRALIKKQEDLRHRHQRGESEEESDVHDHMEQVVWQLFQSPAHVATMINMVSESHLAKTGVASHFNVGAVSLLGVLALMGVVVGAFITRSRRQVRNIQNVGATTTATEMTAQEVA